MDFVSTDYYLWFLPVVFVLTFTIGQRARRRQIIILLLSSYLFFWLASGWHVILLLISTLVDWNVGNKLHVTEDAKKRKRWLTASLVINLGLLSLFKYLDFIIGSWNWVALKVPGSPEFGAVGLLLPVGISFYTFQTMSYSIDIYRRKITPYEDFTSFACYAAFFPQLVAGPIVRADHFREQIKAPLSPTAVRFRLGLTLIVYGLAKKLIIANNLAIHVDSIFVEGAPLDNTVLVWWGALAFGIQIFCDFSAYTDIAIGTAHLFGIRLPENFDAPYAARSPQDFWRRWHISLSTWLRDYLYIPLGGSRNGERVMLMALMATMLLGGLWHGASWNFVLWGLLHGLLLIAHRYLSKMRWVNVMFDKLPRISAVSGWFITQYFVFLTWLVFRVEQTDLLIPSVKAFLGIGAVWDLNEAWEFLPEIRYLTVCLALIFLVVHFISWKVGGLKHWISRQHPIIWGAIIGALLSGALLLQPAETVDFIYFRF